MAKYYKDVTVYVHINGVCTECVITEDSDGGNITVETDSGVITVSEHDLCNGCSQGH